MITKEQKAELIKQYGKNEHDSGSAEVQVAILTARIKELTEQDRKSTRLNSSHP